MPLVKITPLKADIITRALHDYQYELSSAEKALATDVVKQLAPILAQLPTQRPTA